MLSRRHVPAAGPVRLSKSDGQFTPKNILTRVKSALAPKVDKFTAGSCLPASSLDRPNIRNMSCNYGQCPAGYSSFGYDGTQWNYGSACTMYNMICVKNDYNKTDWKTVADCCNGVTPAAQCDPTLCKNSQGCRDKMTSTTWCDSHDHMGIPDCVKYLNALGNEDVRADILSRRCTPADLASGICRDYVTSGKAHGQMDSTVISWCKDPQPAPPSIDPQVSQWTAYRIKGTMQPWIALLTQLTPQAQAAPEIQTWDLRMYSALAAAKNDANAVINPPVTYRDNSKDPICSCILSQLNKTGEKSPPVACFDSACQLSGYQTAGMKTVAANCPSWVECRSTVLAASSGVVDNVKVNQICGEPPAGTYIAPVTQPTVQPVMPATTTGTSSDSGIKDDKTLLKEDEARATTSTPGSSVINVPGIQTISQQLSQPFAPDLFGTASIAEVSIIFFALLILSAILYRTWMNHRAKQLIQGQYEAAIQYDRELEQADQTRAIKESIAAMNIR